MNENLVFRFIQRASHSLSMHQCQLIQNGAELCSMERRRAAWITLRFLRGLVLSRMG